MSTASYDNYSGYNHNPATEKVNGYYRKSPDGSTQYVDSYIRTKADGIESNNFSYKD